MLNVNNIALVGYKTVNVATLDSVPQFFHTPGKEREEPNCRLYGKPADPPEVGTLASAVKEGNCASW